jgi:hypothetical protein
MSDDDNDLSLAIRECVQLFLLNFTSNAVETTLRMRALQDLSEGLDTELLLLLVQATSRARAAGLLDKNLRAYLDSRETESAASKLTGKG